MGNTIATNLNIMKIKDQPVYVQVLLFFACAFLCFIIPYGFFSISASKVSPSESSDVSCSFKSGPTLDDVGVLGLFKYVKGNSYCSKIYVLEPKEDNYGNTVWLTTGYYQLSESEFDEMKKYVDFDHYTYEHPIPNFQSVK